MSDLISRCELFNRLAPVQTLGEAYGIIQGMDTVDAVEVVMCKNCKYYDRSMGYCERLGITINDEDYCSFGERKDGGNGRS